MRVAILNLTGGGMSGGYKAYLENMLPRFAAHSKIEEIFCASPHALNVGQWFSNLSKIKFAQCHVFRLIRSNPDAKMLDLLKKFSPDAIFVPLERPVQVAGFPVITMIQNMGPLIKQNCGNPWSEKIRYILQRYLARVSVKNSNQIIAPTNFVRDFLIKQWNIFPERVTTIYYGSNIPDQNIIIQKPSAIPDLWAEKFLFTAGSIEPYRGLEDVLSAMAYLKGNNKIKGLVIAGELRNNMIGYQKKLKKWIDKQGLNLKICWTGGLNKNEMSWCYKNCNVFVMSSRVESFGLIGLEALAHGCVCLVAQNPPLPEIFNDFAIYYVSGCGKMLSEAIQKSLNWDAGQRSRVMEQSIKRAANFSWDITAKKTVEVFEKAIHNKK